MLKKKNFKFVALFLSFLLITACDWFSSEDQRQQQEEKKIKIVFTGDSFTFGSISFSQLDKSVENPYPNLLIKKNNLTDKSFENTAEHSLTSENLLNKLDEKVLSKKPDIVVITIGGNDFLAKINKADLGSDEGIKELYEWFEQKEIKTLNYIKEIIKKITESNTSVQIVFGLVRPGGLFLSNFSEMGHPEMADSLENWYQRIKDGLLVEEYSNVLLVENIMENIWDKHVSEDMIHPTQKGHEVMTENFTPSFVEALRRVLPLF